MYTVGARTASVDAFATQPDASLTLSEPAGREIVRPAARLVPASVRRPVQARSASTTRDVEVRRDDERSWTKTALIIGGSAASVSGVGGAVKGKKGALIGAAIGGGAASIYEATRRR